MYAVMVKHTPNGKVFWFAAPERLAKFITPGVRVICDTYNGHRYGTAVSTALIPSDVQDVIAATGAVVPLRQIINVAKRINLNDIKVPSHLAHSRPRDEKIARRFLEFYYTNDFQTNITVDENYNLTDGYTAYLVAKKVGMSAINAIVKENNSKEDKE